MIAVDTNLLVYAHREDSEFHDQARESLVQLAEQDAAWAIPWPCIHEFVAIVTHPRIYDPPTPLFKALQAMAVWLEAPSCRLLSEGPGYWETLKHVAHAAKSCGPKVHDARIAALCLHHGVRELWTADRDFSRFSDLRTKNPLIM
ncbi:MAG TPA: PIN domain-containing protein [Kiritimatiellia bacterium]|nr:PIN domain-containing protein [Kiritimatiellia bacterium]